MRYLSPLLPLLLPLLAQADDWPQYRGPQRDGVWREAGIVDRFDGPKLELRWRVPVSNGYTGPTVADGRVYLTDRIEGDEQAEEPDFERVLCFDWQDGKLLWKHVYKCRYKGIGYRNGPRASVTMHEGLAYSLGSVGHLHCLDAVTGEVLWKYDLVQQYKVRMPIWGIAAAPLIEQDMLILHVGGTDACVIALDRKTGKERWTAVADPASYSAPIVIDQADRRVLVCWTGTHVRGLDAATGETLWGVPYKQPKWIISISSPVVDRSELFISGFVGGSLMLGLGEDQPTAETLWFRRGRSERDTDALHCLIGTPVLRGAHIYGVDAYGQLRCLKRSNGDRVWEDTTATSQVRWGNLHIVHHEPSGNDWLFNDVGELIIARLTPTGFEEKSRSKLLSPTLGQLGQRDGVTWSHPAYAYGHVFNRNDEELVCASVMKE